MSVKGLITGDSYDTRVLRREKTSNGFKNRWDKVAEKKDSDTKEKQLKFKSDGTVIPKPENYEFETLWYRDWIDKLIPGGKSHTDFIEVYLKESGEGADGDFVQFNSEKGELEASGNESQFQTHRDLEAEKTLDIFSEDDNQQWYFLAGLGVITMINLGGMYIIVHGLDNAIIKGVKQGFKTVQSSKGAVTGSWVMFSFAGAQAARKIRNSCSSLFASAKETFSNRVGLGK
ncbi:MAG: hypothetical protein ABEK00_02225 [Candidatus Nanohaloarchaea archaeon]